MKTRIKEINYCDKILKVIKKNNSYVTTSEVVENKIEREFLTNIIKSGKIVRMKTNEQLIRLLSTYQLIF